MRRAAWPASCNRRWCRATSPTISSCSRNVPDAEPMSPITALTYVLPHRFLSSLARKLAYSTDPRTKQWLIDTVIRKFGVNMAEAAESDPTKYDTFNAFFTRALKPGARVAEPD